MLPPFAARAPRPAAPAAPGSAFVRRGGEKNPGDAAETRAAPRNLRAGWERGAARRDACGRAPPAVSTRSPSQVSGSPPLTPARRSPSPRSAQKVRTPERSGSEPRAYLWRPMGPGRAFPRESPDPRGGHCLLRRGTAEECVRSARFTTTLTAEPRWGTELRGAQQCASAPPALRGREAGGGRGGPAGAETAASPRPLPASPGRWELRHRATEPGAARRCAVLTAQRFGNATVFSAGARRARRGRGKCRSCGSTVTAASTAVRQPARPARRKRCPRSAALRETGFQKTLRLRECLVSERACWNRTAAMGIPLAGSNSALFISAFLPSFLQLSARTRAALVRFEEGQLQ